jgi:MscS family membrane protein
MRHRARGTNRQFTRTAVPLLVTVTRLVVFLLLLMVVIHMFFGMNIFASLAGLGVAALALGLAAQESVRNWFGALTIFFAKPFAEDDWIIYKEKFGQIEKVGLTATRMRVVDGEVLTIPNMIFIDEPIYNATRRRFLRREMNIAIPYTSSPDQVDRSIEVIREALNDDRVREQGGYDDVGREPHVTFNEYGPDHLNIRAYYWFKVPDGEAGWYDFLAHSDIVNRTVYRRFQEEQLEFAFPTRTLRLRDEAGHAVRVLTGRDGDEDDAHDGKQDGKQDADSGDGDPRHASDKGQVNASRGEPSRDDEAKK